MFGRPTGLGLGLGIGVKNPPLYSNKVSLKAKKIPVDLFQVKGSMSKEESDHKKGAAVVPVCLPLCCAAPCVIM